MRRSCTVRCPASGRLTLGLYGAGRHEIADAAYYVYYSVMINSIHVRPKISAGAVRRALRTCVIVCAALGTFLPLHPAVAFAVTACLSSAVVLCVIPSVTWMRIALALISCAACAWSAWAGYQVCLRPYPPSDILDIVLEILGLFLVWTGSLSAALAVQNIVLAAADQQEHRRAVFRLLLYILCMIFGLLVCILNLRHPALPPGIVICTVLFLLTYVGIGRTFSRQLKTSTQEMVNAESLQKELEIQREQFEQLSAELAVARRTRHDLNNHLTVIATLVREGRRGEAQDYVHSLMDSMRHPADTELFAMSLARTKTQDLEESGVRVQYPDVQVLTPLQRAVGWPWTELMIHAAHDVLRGVPDAVLRLTYCADPLRITAQFSPAAEAKIRSIIVSNLLRLPAAAVQIGASGRTVLVAVLVYD